MEYLPDAQINPFFEAVTQATEEAILNALTAAETMEGRNRNKVYALPHEQVKAILSKYQNVIDAHTQE